VTMVTCLRFPGGEKLVYHKILRHGIFLEPGASAILDGYYDWKFRDMKMNYVEYKKRYIDIKK